MIKKQVNNFPISPNHQESATTQDTKQASYYIAY